MKEATLFKIFCKLSEEAKFKNEKGFELYTTDERKAIVEIASASVLISLAKILMDILEDDQNSNENDILDRVN